MKSSYVLSLLSKMDNASIENRQRIANEIMADTSLFKDIIDITFTVNEKISIKAAWILEWICTHHNLQIIYPFLTEFTQKLKTLQFDSAIRPCAKICEHLAIAYQQKDSKEIHTFLTKVHINNIISVGFEWLITPQKTAVKAYTMTSLYHFGKNQKWVHTELKHLISSKIIHESKGCKARGKQILMQLHKNEITE